MRQHESYLTYFPSVTSDLIPVIIDFHGGAGTAEGQYITSNFIEIADLGNFGKWSFILKQTSRTGSVWNTLHSDEGNKVAGVDDFGFIAAIIESLELNPNIDTSRIYVSGYSNGAAMAYQIACHLNEYIAGFVVMSGLFPLEDEYPCVITHETAGIIINGTSDYERPMTGIEGYTMPVRGCRLMVGCNKMEARRSLLSKMRISSEQPTKQHLERKYSCLS